MAATDKVQANIAGNKNISDSSYSIQKYNADNNTLSQDLKKLIGKFESGKKKEIKENDILSLISQYPFSANGSNPLEEVEKSDYKNLAEPNKPLFFIRNNEGKSELVRAKFPNTGIELKFSKGNESEFASAVFGNDYSILKALIAYEYSGDLISENTLLLPNNFYVNEYIQTIKPTEYALELVFSLVNVAKLKEEVPTESFNLFDGVSLLVEADPQRSKFNTADATDAEFVSDGNDPQKEPVEADTTENNEDNIEAKDNSITGRYVAGEGNPILVSIILGTSEKAAQGLINRRSEAGGEEDVSTSGDTETRGNFTITYY